MPIRTKCLLCNRVLSYHQTFYQYLCSDDLCADCRRLLKLKRRTVQLDDLKVTAFYEYDDFFSDCLIQYKECKDEALKNIFLSEVKDWIFLHYFNCVFLLAPSSSKAMEERGFHPVKQIFEQCGVPMIECFEKKKDIRQKNSSLNQRHQIENVLNFYPERIPENKRLVLIDDAATTGSTLLAMQKLVGKKRVKEALCIAIHPKLVTDFDKMCRFNPLYLKQLKGGGRDDR